MNAQETAYLAALRTTLRQTAAAYGYALTLGTSTALLTSVQGSPAAVDLFFFALGGLLAFAVLDGTVELFGVPGSAGSEGAFPFAGALNLFSVVPALGAADAVAHGVHSGWAWFLAPLLATAIYMTVVAAQVALVGALRDRRRGRNQPDGE